jgi:hypothetical protein
VLHELISKLYRSISGPPSFQVYGKGRSERAWRIIDIHATLLRDCGSHWPLMRGTCITWTQSIIAVGWDFAEELVREQMADPISREFPLAVAGGRLRDAARRQAASGYFIPTASEIMAHECGHTAQARRMGFLYWPIGALLTLFREGPHFWNHFENQASESGLFGGIVRGSMCQRLQNLVR